MSRLLNLFKREPEPPHQCWACGWFKARKPQGNRYCQYPGKLRLNEAQVCLCWTKEPDPAKRVRSAVEL